MRVRFVCAIIVISIVIDNFCATILKGNSGTSTSTFSFNIGPCDFYGGKSNVYSMITGADAISADNIYSVAAYSLTAQQFIPLGVTTVTLNNVANQSNPLTGQKIKYISVHGGDLDAPIPALVVNSTTPASERFFVISTVTLPKSDQPTNVQVNVTRSDVPNDAAGNPCGFTAGLCSGYVDTNGSLQNIVIGAVTQNGSDFGTGNSGIALARYTIDKKSYALTMLNAQTGTTGNKALQVNTSTSAFKVGADLASIGITTLPVINFYWDFYLQRLFVALRVKAAAGADNGARSIAVGHFDNQKLVLDSLLPDALALASDNDAIVAANNGYATSSYKMCTMHTSTGLSYLIVNGGNNPAGGSGIREIPGKIFALPLVNERAVGSKTWLTSATHGTLAAKDQIPTTTYNDANHRFIMRQFKTPATTVDQLTLETDKAALVGAGLLPLIPTTAPTAVMVIKDLFVVNDAVYAAIAASYDNSGGQPQEPGLFHSRAIFDEYGRIAAWTPWQRVNGSDDNIYASGLDAKTGIFWSLTGNADGSVVNTVKQTVWGADAKDGLLGGTSTDAGVGLINILTQQFPMTLGGIQALNDFDNNLNNVDIPYSGLEENTVLLACGYHTFAFVLTGDDSEADGTIKPYTGNFATNMATNSNDTFPSGTGRVFVITGPRLSSIGPLTTQTIFSNDTYSWIAVGGVRGLVILSDESGYGYPTNELPTNFTFKKVGNYAYVQKVVGDGYYLYVLTNSSLERITIDPAAFASGNIQRTIVATTLSLGINNYGCFTDVVIADNLALLATSNGLFRVANGHSIRSGVPQWSPVSLGESVGPAYTITTAASKTNGYIDLAHNGQAFVLAAYQGYDDSQLYRLYIKDGSTVSNSSVQTIGDCFVENTPSYFVSFGQMRTNYVDDGSMRFIVRPVEYPQALVLSALPPSLRLGHNAFQVKYSTAIIQGTGPQGSMSKPIRLSSSGAWLVPGNFGMQVNE
jgi:hypothetical protein